MVYARMIVYLAGMSIEPEDGDVDPDQLEHDQPVVQDADEDADVAPPEDE